MAMTAVHYVTPPKQPAVLTLQMVPEPCAERGNGHGSLCYNSQTACCVNQANCARNGAFGVAGQKYILRSVRMPASLLVLSLGPSGRLDYCVTIAIHNAVLTQPSVSMLEKSLLDLLAKRHSTHL